MLKPLIIYTDILHEWEGLTQSIDTIADISYYIATDIEELNILAKKYNNAVLLFLTKKLIDLTEIGWFWGQFTHRVETIVVSQSKIDDDVKERARFFGVMRLIEGTPDWEKFADELSQTCFSSNWFTAPLMRMPVAKALKMLRTRKKTSMLQVKNTIEEDMPVSNTGKILPDPDTGVKMPAGLGRIYILKGIPFFAETTKEKGIDALEIITSLKSGYICISEWFISPISVNLTDAMQDEIDEIIEYKAQLYESTESRKIELEKFASQQSILDKIILPKEFLDDEIAVKYAQPTDETNAAPAFEKVPDISQFNIEGIPTDKIEQVNSHTEHITANSMRDAVEEQKRYGHHKISERRDRVSKAPKISQSSGIADVHRKMLEEDLKSQEPNRGEEETKVKISELFTDFKDALNNINVSNVKIDGNGDLKAGTEEESSHKDISSRPTKKLSLNNPEYYSNKLQISEVLQQSTNVNMDNILDKFEAEESILGATIIGPTGAIWVSKFRTDFDEVNTGLVSSNYVQSAVSLVKEIIGSNSLSSLENSEKLTGVILEADDNTILCKMTQVRGSFILVVCSDNDRLNNVVNLINETLLEIEHIII